MFAIAGALTALSLPIASHAEAQNRYYHLGFLVRGSNGPSIAFGVSHNGKYVVGETNVVYGVEAFIWTPATNMIGIGELPGGFNFSTAYAIDNHATIAIGASDDGSSGEGGAPCAFTKSRGPFALQTLDGPTTYGQAEDITPDGRIAVGASQNPTAGLDAVLWDRNTGLHNLGDLPGGVERARASAVSADGTIVVGTGSTTQFGFDTAFRWTVGTGMVALPSSGLSAALDVSAEGKVVVGEFDGHAGRWTETTGWVNLGVFGIERGNYIATAANRDGSVVVGLANYDGLLGTGEAFIWDSGHGIRSMTSYLTDEKHLRLNGLNPFWARGISDDGRVIVGYGFNPDGEQEGFAAIISE